ncbi:MAG: VWA domain-containing protein [Pseudomonadota bacterium]
MSSRETAIMPPMGEHHAGVASAPVDADLREPGDLRADALARSAAQWRLAMNALHVFAVDPHGIGGLIIKARHGPVRERMLALVKDALGPHRPLVALPPHADAAQWLGALDLSATLKAGRPVHATGLLARAKGGCVLLRHASRLGALQMGLVVQALDQSTGADGIGFVALDEAAGDEEGLESALLARTGLCVALDGVALSALEGDALHALQRDGWSVLPSSSPPSGDPAIDLDAARALYPHVTLSPDAAAVLCKVAAAYAIDSVRAPLKALRAARAHAALQGRQRALPEDVEAAAALVFAWAARALPEPPEPPAETDEAHEPPPPPPADSPDEATDLNQAPQQPDPTADRIVDATRAALPADLLARLLAGQPIAKRSAEAGSRAGIEQRAPDGPVRLGTKPGRPGGKAQVALFSTLLAAAPRQRLRETTGHATAPAPAAERDAERDAHPGVSPRLQVRGEDIRIYRKKRRQPSVTILAVDASGSQALTRLNEAKGAVELLLSDCYVRRDQAALIAFRGDAAHVLLPPTGALARAKRSLAVLPGGGGTPLAAGLAQARLLAERCAAQGRTPLVIILTDGRANIARDGQPGRAQAQSDALEEAGAYAHARWRALLVDTSTLPDPRAKQLSDAMGATYLALPRADAAGIQRAVETQR